MRDIPLKAGSVPSPVYTAIETHSGKSAAFNALVLTAPSDKHLSILEARISNPDQETNEQILCGLYRATAAGTGAPTAITPKNTIVGGAASGATVGHTYATTEPTLETDPIFGEGVASLNGYVWLPTNGRHLIVPPGEILVLRIATATFSAFDPIAFLCWAETE